MRKLSFIIILFSSYSVTSQVNEKLLADTVLYLTMTVNNLSSKRVNQEAYRLSFDDCNLEFKISNLDDDESWSLESFWLADIDNRNITIEFSPLNEEWELKLFCIDKARKIKGTSGHTSWSTYGLSIHGSEKAQLNRLKNSIIYAIRSCRESGRYGE